MLTLINRATYVYLSTLSWLATDWETKLKSMYEIVKSVHFCYGHRLINYHGPCANLHGHNAKADIMLANDKLNAQGMVMDFGDITSGIGKWINDSLDHTMLLGKGDPLISVFEQRNEKFYLMDDNPTAENIAKHIYEYAEQHGYPIVAVTLWESETSFARYSR